MSDTTGRRRFDRRESIRALLTFLIFALIAFLGPFVYLWLSEEPPPVGKGGPYPTYEPPAAVAPPPVLKAPGADLSAPIPARENGPATPVVPIDAADATSFPGMVAVPAGPFTMGVDESWLVAQFRPGTDRSKWHPALARDDGFLWWNLLLETPAHEERTDRYFIDRYPVTNAQYERFLLDTARLTLFVDAKRRTLRDLAEGLFGMNPSEDSLTILFRLNEEKLDRLKAGIYEKNALAARDAVEAFNAGRPAGARAPNFDSLPDRERIAAWVDFRLPLDTAIVALSRRVPATWPRGRVPPEIAGLPVVDVTALDAEDYAAWAGKHVVTEFEWEKAARAPDGRLWPWGNTFDVVRDRNLLNWLETDVPPRGPAAPMKDRPIAVDAIPAGAAPCGCLQMLGNVFEITSTPPWLYPGSTAAPKPWFGKPRYRVLRGGASFGQGLVGRVYGGPKRELLIRSTSRFVGLNENVQFTEVAHYMAIGFRTAKDPVPARDAIGLRVRAAQEGARFRNLEFAPGFGVEANAYAAPGAAAPGFTFVLGPTRAVGIAPAAGLPFDDPESLRQATEGVGPVVVAFLAATPGLEVQGDSPDREGPLCVAWSEGRAWLFERKILGYERLGSLEDGTVKVVRSDDAEADPAAKIDPATGVVTFRLPFAFASAGGRLVFTFSVRVKGDLSGSWRGVSE